MTVSEQTRTYKAKIASLERKEILNVRNDNVRDTALKALKKKDAIERGYEEIQSTYSEAYGGESA